ncbi:MAG: tetratricopeptide repeat protein [Planctomycetota bacterium]|jgi:tetratricopeptide (TPR) repeat protein
MNALALVAFPVLLAATEVTEPSEVAELPAGKADARPIPERLREKAPDELVVEGNQMYAGGDYDGAISRYGAAQSARQNSPEVDMNLGLAHLRKGEHDRAAEYFIASAGKGGGRLSSKAHHNLGNCRARQGRFEDAIAAYKAALEADPANADASHNLELVQRHLAKLKEDEAKRKAAEEHFKKRLEALRKELAALVEAQAMTLARTWSTDAGSAGPFAVEKHFKELQKLAGEKKPVPDDLGAKVARRLVVMRELEALPSTPKELGRIERSLAGRARAAAETAAILAADLREAAGPDPKQRPPPPGHPPGSQPEKPTEHPLVEKLQRAGGSAEEASRRLEKAADILSTAPNHPARPAEPVEAEALWRLVTALGDLSQPPQQGQGERSKELEEALKRMSKLRARQGALVRDLWATIPAARGKLPSPDEQKAFWESVRDGEAPDEDARVPMARLEIMGTGRPGSKRDAAALAEGEKSLAEDARALAAEVEAIATKAGATQAGAGGGAQEQIGAVVAMLRDAARGMDAAAAKLEASPPDSTGGEDAGVRAFVRLSQAPNAMTELMARLGGILAEQMMLVLDTWKSDPAARGPVATREEMEEAAKAMAASQPGGGAHPQSPGAAPGVTPAPAPELDPELEAKLGRVPPAAAAQQLGDAAGAERSGDEAAKLEADLAKRAREAAEDLRKLASSGRPGEMNQMAAQFEGAAADVDSAALRMDEAADELPTSFVKAEPLQARAVAALMRAMARFSSGASGQSNEQNQEGQEQEAEQKEAEKGEKKDEGEDEKEEGDLARPDEEKEPSQDEQDEKKDAKKAEPMSKERAKRMLEEAAQQERDLRRDINKRRGTKGVEVRRDW